MELWDAYNKNEEKAGVDLIRGEEIPKGLYHLVVSTVVRHKDGTYLLLRRSENCERKPVFEPSGWSHYFIWNPKQHSALIMDTSV